MLITSLCKRSSLNRAQFSKRHLLIVVGAFAFINLLNPAPVSARSAVYAENQASINRPLAEKNAETLTELEKAFTQKQQSIKKQAEKAEQAKTEAKSVVETKAQLIVEVEAVKAQIKEAKLKLEEKKAREAEEARLLALKTVRIGSYAGDAAGNMYAPGNCTWYVKSRRPDIGNYWGNANSWYASAQADGFETGTSPKVGAVGVSFNGWLGHVVYVEAVDNGSITISEMNVAGLYSTATRTASPSEFVYIYGKP